jgi:glycosyltransferase involved in cell wall biosynthesis
VDVFVKAAAACNLNNELDRRGLFLVVGRQETSNYVSLLPEAQELGSSYQLIPTTDDVPRLLNGTDVFVAPSRTEGFSFAVIEAMAAGKLILCSDIPGIRESFGDSGGMWLCPSEDWGKLAELMKRAMALPPKERERLGDLNIQFVKARYSLEKWADGIAQMYKTLLAP